MSDGKVDAFELLDAIQQYKEQLAAVADVISEDSNNIEAQQIYAELQEALTATEAAYVECSQHKNAAAAADSHGAATAAPAASVHPKAAAPRTIGRSMHPENIYASQEPDFAALAAQHSPLAPFVTVTKAGRPSIDFTNWHATKELTAALLNVDFGVTWDLPGGQLVPPVPNRANYIHWISDLLQLSSPAGDVVRGLDIGCGANLIYCLLGAAIYGWHMTGVDVTEVALQGASSIRDANPQLANLLDVRQSKSTVQQLPQQQQQQQQQVEPVLGPLLGAMVNSKEVFHFCMCNPPFFESIHEANQNPNTACGGTPEEMVCPGGELAFIRAMISDSKELGSRVHWYSSMCGKKASLKVLRQELHAAGVIALRTTELVQGKTSRWAIAWSFAASPNTSNMPLPRRQQQNSQQQQRQQLSRASPGVLSSLRGSAAQKVTFTVTASPADGRKLLQSLAALLAAVGKAQQVRTDFVGWKVTCQLPAAAGDSTEQQQQQQLHQQGEKEEECGGSEPLQKRARMSDESGGSSSGRGGSGDSVEVAVFQQRRGTFDVVARLQSGSSPSKRLAGVVAAVREDIALMWSVSDLYCQ